MKKRILNYQVGGLPRVNDEPVPDADDLPQGPRRKAPTYYIGERCRGRLTAAPDAERCPNGVLPGIRNKAARRMIRKVFGRSLSRVEQHILKARDVRLEVERLATNGHEARLYFEKTLALHKPVPQPPTRAWLREHDVLPRRRNAKKAARVK